MKAQDDDDSSLSRVKTVAFDWVVDLPGPNVGDIDDKEKEEGKSVDFQVTDSNGDALTNCRFAAAGLPPGLSIDDAGNISGTIEQGAGADNPTYYDVTVTVTDENDRVTEAEFTWKVALPKNRGPALNEEYPKGGLVRASNKGDQGDLNLSDYISSPEQGDSVRYVAYNLPLGLTLDEATGEISGTIAQDQSARTSNTVEVSVTDERGEELRLGFEWEVKEDEIASNASGPFVITEEAVESQTEHFVLSNETTAQFHFLCGADDGLANTEDNLNTRTFDVVDVEGEEAVSQLYGFEINLVSKDPNVNFSKINNRPTRLLLKRGETWDFEAGGDTDRAVSGLVVDFEMTGRGVRTGQGAADYYFYRARLVPRLWWLTLSHRSRVFQHRSVPGIIRDVLDGYKDPISNANQFAEDTDYTFNLEDEAVYYEREYCVQYKETDLAFISRLMEYEGLYFFFEEGASGEKLVITDYRGGEVEVTAAGSTTNGQLAAPAETPFIATDQLLNLSDDEEENVTAFRYRERVTEGRVALRDCNYEDFDAPLDFSEDLTADEELGETETQRKKRNDSLPGVYQEYGKLYKRGRPYVKTGHTDADSDGLQGSAQKDYVRDRERQVRRIARVRREEIACRRRTATGTGDCRTFAGGHRFMLTHHFRDSLNRVYLLTRVAHAGSQAPMVAGKPPAGSNALTRELLTGASDSEAAYYNEFACLPTTVQYRPERQTPVPRVNGILTARVEKPDGASDDQAYLDDEGRYRVRMPFDDSSADGGSADGSASQPIRMAQPYAGKNYGMHFPNHAGAEMVFACIDGDVDRPIALSTVPDWQHHAPVPNQNPEHNWLPSQNSPTGHAAGSAGIGVEPEGFGDTGKTTFEATKNVLQTKRGHRLVMDDASGTGNVGISLQTGKGEMAPLTWGGTGNPYWHSRIDLGGYRAKAAEEQVLESATEVIGWMQTLSKRLAGLPEAAGIISAALAEQTVTGGYFGSTFGTTSPVGIAGVTDQAVNFAGAGGVNLVMPNILGVWGAGVIPGYGPGQHRVANAFLNFFFRTIYQQSVEGTIDEIKKTRKLLKKAKAKAKTSTDPKDKKWWRRYQAWLVSDENSLHEYFKDGLEAALGHPAINLKSAAGINVSALGKANIVGGYGGIGLNSLENIVQKAAQNINVNATQGVTIKATGQPNLSAHGGIAGVWADLAQALHLPTGLATGFGLLGGGKSGETFDPGDLDLYLVNENQHIGLYAKKGEIWQRAKSNIEFKSDEGSVTCEAGAGSFIAEAVGKQVRLARGSKKNNQGQLQGNVSTLTLDSTYADVTSAGDIRLRAGGGQGASILLLANGDVVINGKNVTVKSEGGTLNLAVAAAASGQGQAQPPPQRIVPPPQSPPIIAEMTLSGNPSPAEVKMANDIKKLNADIRRVHQQKKQQYEAYLQQLKTYHKTLVRTSQQVGQEMASIKISSNGDVAVGAKKNVDITECVSFTVNPKVKSQFKGPMFDANVTGIVKIKGSLAKVG